ncbi:MAG: hypothetical protein LWW98_11745 [Deltaproteobacteria bacterium]|nr:hypothetical protein [Deltaproteobacteria bacterium]
MRYITKYLLCFFVIVNFAGCLSFSTGHSENSEEKSGDIPVGTIYYTGVNIWYEKPNKISSINYHKGTKLPIGTKVKIVGFGNRKIQFIQVDTSQTFTIVHHKKYTRIKLKELFDRYFSEKRALAEGGCFHDVTKNEKENIKNGSIAFYMSKAAVVMAYGYPPSHKTPLLSNNVWYYWHSRFQEVIVHFKDNKLYKIERMEPILPGMKRHEVESVSGE